MAKEAIVTWIDKSVLDVARLRVSRIFDEFEDIVVSVSGGKDSTVIAHLFASEAFRRNRQIKMFFEDEEVVYMNTIDQVRKCMSMFPNNILPLWYQLPFALTNAAGDRDSQLIAWEPGKHKKWMRSREPNSIQKPNWAHQTVIKDKVKGLQKDGSILMGFYDVITNVQMTYKNTAVIVGLRATESPNRYRAMMKAPGYTSPNTDLIDGKITIRKTVTGEDCVTKFKNIDKSYDPYFRQLPGITLDENGYKVYENPGIFSGGKDCFWSTANSVKDKVISFYPIYDFLANDVWKYIAQSVVPVKESDRVDQIGRYNLIKYDAKKHEKDGLVAQGGRKLHRSYDEVIKDAEENSIGSTSELLYGMEEDARDLLWQPLSYHKYYDFAYLKGAQPNQMRVSSLIHEKSFKAIENLAEFEPETLEKLSKRLDGIQFASEHAKDVLRVKTLPKGYKTWKAYRDFLLVTKPKETEQEKRIYDRFIKRIDGQRKLICEKYGIGFETGELLEITDDVKNAIDRLLIDSGLICYFPDENTRYEEVRKAIYDNMSGFKKDNFNGDNEYVCKNMVQQLVLNDYENNLNYKVAIHPTEAKASILNAMVI